MPGPRRQTCAAEALAESAADVVRLIPLQVGALTASQIALLLTHLPVDVTYVDEHDEVRFYSATRNAYLTASRPSSVARYKQCHPPTSLHRVQRILDDFATGGATRRILDPEWRAREVRVASSSIFAILPCAMSRATTAAALEVTQDVTAIRKLEGERRCCRKGISAYAVSGSDKRNEAARWPSAGRSTTGTPGCTTAPDGAHSSASGLHLRFEDDLHVTGRRQSKRSW